MKGNPEAEGLTVDSFRALCDSSVAKHECQLSWGSYSQVMVRDKILPSREEDVRSLFTGLNNLFGHINTPSTRTFNMFEKSNSLFDTSAYSSLESVQQRLEQIEDFLKKAKLRPDNYEIAVRSMNKCSTPSSANRVSLSLTLVFICLILRNNN
ncbi:uncharacterized protein LOC124356301 [Homalodisca vitripennis]|uniref:uncharacterized protein LOC124356301 n=1 Tax=Homalodisca vitripennis TaxID=197043 RepID=UPI001EEAF954|nr:uncharacterized protein LOC124356301 [Homalodisca vitripennis]